MTEKKILIVDDDDLLLMMLKRYLEHRGFKYVRAVPSGEASLEALSRFCFDTMILDINLPGINGWDVLERVKAAAPDTEVIMITGNPAETIRYKSIQSGAFALLEKPFTLEELNSVLQGTFRPACAKRVQPLRAVCRMPSKIIQNGLEVTGMLENMSGTGILIKMDRPCNSFRTGSEVDIVLLSVNSCLTVKGEITRQNSEDTSGQFIGIRLMDPSRSYQNLLDYILAG
ncbi:MAG: response regulator [Nitrospiraceae bacterium]|nr:MAG: response regulator [Nitrospiraceae bacterium]